MKRNLILCSDGTGNRGGKTEGTNVWALYNAVDRQHLSGEVEQLPFYDDGVGTDDNKYLKAIGGAFGFGFRRNVQDLYRFLLRQWHSDQDAIYLFGFSRGAYTVRAFAGMLWHCGLPNPDPSRTEEQVQGLAQQAFKAYARRPRGHARSQDDSKLIEGHLHVPVQMVGVWDTVEALGMPVDELKKLVNFFYPFRFYDADLNPSVERGVHALAVDDERQSFTPEIWSEVGREDRIQQAWFPGVHSNVGGGYPKQGMSQVPLHWIAKQAEGEGLRYRDDFLKEVAAGADPNARIYDSRSGIAVYYRYQPRDIETLQAKPQSSERPVMVKVHRSVVDRLSHGTMGYAPRLLPAHFMLVDDDGEVPLHSGSPDPEKDKELKQAYALAREGVRDQIGRLRNLYFAFVTTSLVIVAGLVTLNFIEVALPDSTWSGHVTWGLEFLLPDIMQQLADNLGRLIVNKPLSFDLVIVAVVAALLLARRVMRSTLSGLCEKSTAAFMAIVKHRHGSEF